MHRWMKRIALLCAVVFTFSLIGCGTAVDSSKEQKEDTKITAVKHKEETKKETKKEQPADTSNVVAEQNKPEQAAAQVSAETKETQTVQAPASTTKTNTNTAAASKTTAQAAVQTPAAPAAPAAPSTPPPPTVVPPSPKPAATVTLSIVGPKEIEKPTIMEATKVKLEEGDTIYTVMKRNAKVDSSGSGATTYIKGINDIYERDYGGLTSGWIFKLNGASITKSVGVITVKEGDKIECIYTE